MTKLNDFKVLMVSQVASPSDLQMQLPLRPKLVAGVQPVWHSRECLVMVGCANTVVLRGQAVSSVLPALLPLLDGTRTLEQLGQQMGGLAARALEQAVMLLYMRGLLVGEAEPDSDPVVSELEREPRWQPLLAAYERCLDVTRVCRSAGAVLATMQRAHLLLVSDSDAALDVLAALKELGLGAVTLLTPHAGLAQQASALGDAACKVATFAHTPGMALPQDGAPYTLCAFIGAGPDVRGAQALAGQLGTLPLMYAVLGERELRVGPCADVPASACLHCAEASGVFDENGEQRYGSLERALGAERVAHKLLQLITRVVPVDAIERSETFDAATMQFNARPVLRQFGCPHCAPLHAPWAERPGLDLGGARQVPLPWFYHRQSQHAAYLMAPKGHQAHYASKNKQASAGGYKHYRSRPRITLEQAGRRSPGFAHLARLLHLAVGRRVCKVGPDQHFALRFTPSGGSMSSQNVYVLSYEEGMRGCYYFDPNGYWQRLSEQAPTLAELGLLCEDAPPPRFALLLTSAHARLESKYGSTAYRYAFYDAGALMASLQALAPQHGFACRTSAHFDDDAVSAVIGALQTNEFAAAVVTLADCPAPLPLERTI